jgi:hypothetical protein
MDNVTVTKDEIRITIPKFKTHVNKNKTSKIKVNSQSIYSGVNHFTRGKIVGELHKHLAEYIPEDLDLSSFFPISIRLELHIPPNYEGVKMLKGKLHWKPPAKEYHEPRFDADNQWLWIKTFQDTLKERGVIPEDNVMWIPDTGRITFVPVDHIDKRKLVFVITRHSKKWKKRWLKYFNFFNYK